METETKTTEQETAAEEQVGGTEKQILDSLLTNEEAQAVLEEEAEPVATEEGEPVAEEGKPKDEAPKALTEDEIRERILSEANSIAAKSLVSLQQTNEVLKKKLADKEIADKQRQREADRARLEGAEIEKWGDTPEVKEFQETRAKNEEFFDRVSVAYEAETAKWEKTNNESINLRLFLKYNLPDGEAILKQLDNFAKELGEGSEAERELKALRNSLKTKEPPKKAVKLDSGRLSSPGGRDRSKYKAKDWVTEGLAESKK